MNYYRYQFVSHCPINGDSIVYELLIASEKVVMVESIEAACKSMERALHEVLADVLQRKLGGEQTLTARHGAVDVRTERNEVVS